MKTYFEGQTQVTNNAVKSFDTETFTQLATECEAVPNDGHEIISSGLGKNVPMCEKFVGTMNSFGLVAALMNTDTAVHDDIGMVQNGDLAIIPTKSDDISEPVYLTSLLEQRNIDLWLLSFQRNSTLAERTLKRVILGLEHEGNARDITLNNSTTVNLIILQGLAIVLSERTGVTLADFKKNHPGGHTGKQLGNVQEHCGTHIR